MCITCLAQNDRDQAGVSLNYSVLAWGEIRMRSPVLSFKLGHFKIISKLHQIVFKSIAQYISLKGSRMMSVQLDRLLYIFTLDRNGKSSTKLTKQTFITIQDSKVKGPHAPILTA